MKRTIIEINRTLCNGCALCTTACGEGALELDADNKAVLVRDIYCDGLGACLDVCPAGALQVVEKDVAAYDQDATLAHVASTRGPSATAAVHRVPHILEHKQGGCPGSQARNLTPSTQSGLSQWPIQLQLVSPAAPYFHECDLLVAADCTAFALGTFHADLLRGKALVIACPKLDQTDGYAAKLVELLAGNTVYSITVAIMEVPCCSSLSRIVADAVDRSGKKIAVKTVIVGIEGQRR